MIRSLADLDDVVGARIERAIVAHHQRRLGRLDQPALGAAAGRWASSAPPPRTGNAVDVLVDGDEALGAIAGAIEGARSSVWLAGWHFAPDFRLRFGETRTLRDLLAELAERVDVLVLAWAGAPLPLFRPDRRELRAMRVALARGSRVRVALDAHERPMHCHHEKLVVVDGEVAFVGGIDLTAFAGDRLDTREHPSRGSDGWHDAAVRLRGPAVADVAAHFALRWHAVTGERLAPPEPSTPAGDVELQVVRTVPERTYAALPRGDFAILETYLRALRSAERLVYLENQFLWSPEIVAVLEAKLRNPPDDRFRMLAVLPRSPKNGADDTRGQLGRLVAADAGAGRFLACSLHQRGAGGRPVYVHAKIAIVDDRWLTLGSANLNEHSLFNDTEMNVATWDADLTRATRLGLWSEHLECDREEVGGDPAELIDEVWRRRAAEQLRRERDRLPLTHGLVGLNGVSRRVGAFRGPINGLLVDG